MPHIAQSFADRLYDAVSSCLKECSESDNASGCAAAYIVRLREDSSWLPCDVDRVERAVFRMINMAATLPQRFSLRRLFD